MQMAKTIRRVYTPASGTARSDLLEYLEASCYLVISHDGHWGRGDTVEKAAQACIKAGAHRSKFASVLLILGDETAELNAAGYIIRDAGSHSIKVLERIKLSSLTKNL
jgi:hypothetical protein